MLITNDRQQKWTKKIVFLICQVGAQTSVGLRREFEEIDAQETVAQNHHQLKSRALPRRNLI